MNQITRYDLTECCSTGEIDISPVPPHLEGRFVTYEDYSWLATDSKTLQDALREDIRNVLSLMAGEMLNQNLDSGSKQAVAYAECADMVAKFAASLDKEKRDE